MPALPPPMNKAVPPKTGTSLPPPASRLAPVSKLPPSNKAAVRVPKTFAIQQWTGQGEGEKIILVGASGLGKTTLASMLPGPVFIGLDDGGRKIKNPKTGEPVNAVAGITDFQDLLDVLNNPGLFLAGRPKADRDVTVVIDTATKAEELAEPYIFANVKTDKGATVRNLEGYGWGKGYKHSQDTMRLILQACDGLIRKGINVCLLCQEKAVPISNAEGLDFLQAGPKLHHTNQFSTRLDFQEWADHVFRIGYHETEVAGAEGAKVGKITSSNTTRVVYTSGARHFFAKSRPILSGETMPAVVSFENQADDSAWQFLFKETP